jgi:hypothetical protein
MSRPPSRPTTPMRPESTTPTQEMSDSPRKSRSHSTTTDRRPMGPRAPSPLPPKSPDIGSDSLERALESTLDHLVRAPPVTPPHQMVKHSASLSRSRRLPLEPKANDATPRANMPTVLPSSVEPLSIKKKISVRSGNGASPPSRRHTHAPARAGSTRRTSPQVRGVKRTISLNDHGKPDLPDRLLVTAQSTREDVSPRSVSALSPLKFTLTKVESVRRVVKRIKLEVGTLKTSLPKDDNMQDGESDFPASRSVLPRSPHTRHISVCDLEWLPICCVHLRCTLGQV